MELLHDFATWRFWRHFALKTGACAGALSTALQVWGIVYPNTAIFRDHPIATLTAMLLPSLVVGLIFSWPRPIEVVFSAPNTKIRVVKGDLLKQDQHLVIGICDTFDTEIPNIISRNSLQGQALDVLFGGDIRQMDRHISQALQGQPIVGSIKKPGKTEKYGIGTVAVTKHGARRLFFVAYCEMNDRNEASGTIDNVWKSLLALWAEVSAHGNGLALSIPVIGGGQARGISSLLPAQDAIRLIALSFMFASRKAKVCDELRIVVTPDNFVRLDRLEIQSFLSSLRPS